MSHICVLGDSLSSPGYGLSLGHTWPSHLKSLLGADWEVSVCAQGELRASLSVSCAHGGEKYFGFSRQLGCALNTNADHLILFLGTNDALASVAHVSRCSVAVGVRRLMLQIGSATKEVFQHKPTFHILPPPCLFQTAAESRRQAIILPALQDAASNVPNTRLIDTVPLTPDMKHNDGVHLNALGVVAVAEVVHRHFAKRKRCKKVLKQVRRRSLIRPARKRKAREAARVMGKQPFMAMTRRALRAWARKFSIPFSGGGCKEDEQRAILSKIDSRWLH